MYSSSESPPISLSPPTKNWMDFVNEYYFTIGCIQKQFLFSESLVIALENAFKEFLQHYSQEPSFDWVSKISGDISDWNVIVRYNWHLFKELVKSVTGFDFEKISSSSMQFISNIIVLFQKSKFDMDFLKEQLTIGYKHLLYMKQEAKSTLQQWELVVTKHNHPSQCKRWAIFLPKYVHSDT